MIIFYNIIFLYVSVLLFSLRPYRTPRYPFAVHADAAAMLLGRAPPSLEISEARGETAGLCDEDQVVPPWLLPGCGDGSAGGAGLSSCASTPILNLSGVSQVGFVC